jgi:high affinity Mn2+ porin
MGAALASIFAGSAALAQSNAPAEPAPPLPLKASPSSAVPYDWSGWYVGGHVAYSFGQATSALSDPNLTVTGDSFGSLYGGVQGGYNYVLPSRIFLGAEADVTFPNFQTYEDGVIFTGGTPYGTTVTDEIDYIATLRARFGYAFDHWLIYGTGGFAWSQARFGETPGVASTEDKILRTRAGWTLGLGAERAIAPNWTARIEYLYDDFAAVAGVFPSGTGYRSVFDLRSRRARHFDRRRRAQLPTRKDLRDLLLLQPQQVVERDLRLLVRRRPRL